jgi:hypothetical protein
VKASSKIKCTWIQYRVYFWGVFRENSTLHLDDQVKQLFFYSYEHYVNQNLTQPLFFFWRISVIKCNEVKILSNIRINGKSPMTRPNYNLSLDVYGYGES